MFARGDPRWQEFWRNKLLHQKVATYLIAPALEIAGALLRAAGNMWHPVKRREQKKIIAVACDLGDKATILRTNGIGWLSQTKLGDGASALVSGHPKRLYHGVRGATPETAPASAIKLVELASFFLSRFDSALLKMEREHHNERWLTGWLFERRETLLEIIPEEVAFSDDVIRALTTLAMLLECEMLAHLQALIEDKASRGGGKVRTRKPELTDEEIAKLANDIDVPVDAVHAAFSREYSGWWDVSARFLCAAEREREKVSGMLFDREAIENVRAAFDVGSPYADLSPQLLSDQASKEAAIVTELLIGMFLAYPGAEDAHNEEKSARAALCKRLPGR